MTYEEKREFKKIQNASFDSWYEVTYIKSYMDFQCSVREYQTTCRNVKLRLDNINGWGTGTVFFVTEDNKLMVLNWRAIVAMIPIKS